MTNNEIRRQILIGRDTFDVIYKSLITGNLGTFDELRKGRWSDQDTQITPKTAEPFALRRRHTKETAAKLRLIIDESGFSKARCPRCYYLKKVDLGNGRIGFSLGNNYPVNSAKVDFGGNRQPRRRETSKYCECCDNTYVAEKIKVARY